MKKLLTILLVFVVCISCIACSTNNTNNSTQPDPTPSSCTHIYSSATCTSPQKCLKCGVVKGSALGHNYTMATCTGPKSCTRCSATTGSPLGHSYSSATCTKPKTCTRCGNTTGSKLNHNWNSGVITQKPTCTASGVKTYTCANCQEKKTETIAEQGHSYSNTWTIDQPATCTTSGIKSNHCTKCNSSINHTVIPMTNHNAVNGICNHCNSIINAQDALKYYIKRDGDYLYSSNSYSLWWRQDSYNVVYRIEYYIDDNSFTFSAVGTYNTESTIYTSIFYNEAGKIQPVGMCFVFSDGYELWGSGNIDRTTFHNSNYIYDFTCSESSLYATAKKTMTTHISATLTGVNTILKKYNMNLHMLGFNNYT